MLKKAIVYSLLVSLCSMLQGQADLSTMVTLSKKYTNAIELLDTLATRTGLQFSYRPSLLKRSIKMRRGTRPLQEVIDYLCSKTNSVYSIVNSTIVIKALKTNKFTNQRIVSGKIEEDSTGEAIPFAFIYIENTINLTGDSE